jgi:hypothetical protein
MLSGRTTLRGCAGGAVGAARGPIKKGEEAEVSPGAEFDNILNRGVTLRAYR